MSAGSPVAQAPSCNPKTQSHPAASVGEALADPPAAGAQADAEHSDGSPEAAARSLSGNQANQAPAKAGQAKAYMHTAIFDPACVLGSLSFANPNAFIHEAELFACKLLEKGSISQLDLANLFDLLPKESSLRASEGQVHAWR